MPLDPSLLQLAMAGQPPEVPPSGGFPPGKTPPSAFLNFTREPKAEQGGAPRAASSGSLRLSKSKSNGNFHKFDILKDGKRIGSLDVAHNPEDASVFVDWPESEGVANTLGTSQVRSLVAELQREFPGLQSISGDRPSGKKGMATVQSPASASRLPSPPSIPRPPPLPRPSPASEPAPAQDSEWSALMQRLFGR